LFAGAFAAWAFSKAARMAATGTGPPFDARGGAAAAGCGAGAATTGGVGEDVCSGVGVGATVATDCGSMADAAGSAAFVAGAVVTGAAGGAAELQPTATSNDHKARRFIERLLRKRFCEASLTNIENVFAKRFKVAE